jgi:poly-beta-1,6-N-acetyl-D-glucosamine synthase
LERVRPAEEIEVLPEIVQYVLVLMVIAAVGPNSVFWAAIGLLRLADEKLCPRQVSGRQYANEDVAVVIAAHNEEVALPACLAAVLKLLPAEQIFIGNDASTDATKAVAKNHRCKVYTARKNVGKAKVLEATIQHFDLCTKYKLVMFLDADSEIDGHYLEYALPVFEDPQVGVLAGHVISRPPSRSGLHGLAIHYYRVRLYAMVQWLLKFGQTWKFLNVTFVAPGFASVYRSSVLRQLEIAAPGLVIEDINMTFEVHRKNLGRVAYSPRASCCTEDPASIRDYSKQVKRWTLGLWQAFASQGLWASRFCAALVLGQIEVICFSIFVLALPVFTIFSLIIGGQHVLWSPVDGPHSLSYLLPLALFIGADIATSLLIAIVLRDVWIFLYSPFFWLFRLIDAYWALATIVMTFYVKSDGRWISPTRQVAR